MKIWGRAKAGWTCGACGEPFETDAWVCFITLPHLRPKRRCVDCADEPVPPLEPPPRLEYPAVTFVDDDGLERPVASMRSIRELAGAMVDFKRKAAND
jgi:hypothetical protein